MADNLQRYLPEFDEDEVRQRLASRSREELLELLVRAYKEKRVIAKVLDEEMNRTRRIKDIVEERWKLLSMPDVPGEDDLRRMMEE